MKGKAGRRRSLRLRIVRIITVYLSICLILFSTKGGAIAGIGLDVDASNQTDEYFRVPDSIDEDEADLYGYVGRAIEDEKDLYSFVFRDNEGGYTMRTFAYPVKYINESGETKDISLKICSGEDGNYYGADHPIRIEFPGKSSKGIALEYDDISISMFANSVENSDAVLSEDGRRIVYSAGQETRYEYSLTCCGIKEDIVVTRYTGQTEYAFFLKTNGLHPIVADGSVFLADQDGSIRVSMGDVLVFSADEKNNTFGSYRFSTVEDDMEYLVTIVLDEEYLKDPDTSYPIIIDPTLEINYANNGAGAIQDVTINQNTTYGGTSGSLYVGRHSDGSLSRALMRFPNLNLPVKFAPLILSARVELRDLMCQGSEPMTINCYSYSESAPTWTESGTTTWNSVGSSYLGTLLDSRLVSFGQGNVAAHRYGFDITDLVKQWADGSSSPGKGLVFKATAAFEGQTGSNVQYWYKTFASYNRASYKPSLLIRYEKLAVFSVFNSADGSTRYLKTTGTGNGGASFSSSVNNLSGKQIWCIEYLTAYDAVNIVSLGWRYTGGTKPYVIYNTATETGLDYQQYSSTNRQYKPILYAGNMYYFKNVSNNRYLSINGSYNALTSSTTQNAQSRFSLSKIATDSFNNFWSGGYSVGIYSGVVYIKIQLDSSVTSHTLFSGNNFAAAKWWNGVTEKVKIYGPNDSVPSGITPLVVTFKADTGVGSNNFASTIPNGYTLAEYSILSVDQKNSLLISAWSGVTIYLNGSSVDMGNPFYSLSGTDRETQINKVICHEMGHALKLAHPSENNNSGARHYFSGARGNYSSQEAVYAVMNQGLFNENSGTRKLTAASPQDHDWINLISKWEYHLNCNH